MDVTFIDDGPGIPEELLREHEEGKVVFFCGAGVSCATGLPSFSGLVKSVAKRLRLFDDQIKEEWLNERYDYALGKLEEIAPGKRREIRSIVHQILTSFKKNTRPNTETHDVLIRLATTRETGHCHLVTTNFDRLFEKAISSDSNFESYTAPLLPIPRDGIWNGIVYLHGLAPESFDEFAMDKLVYSNRDFGKAYLTDGWAARFTTELLKNYTLCFVGYSLSDPLLRYLVDALPAENSHKVYTFADYNHGKFPREKVKSQWESKHVIPILFDADSCGGHYHALHMTLKKWAAVYEADFNAKEQIIKTDAIRDPVTNSKTDDFVDRVIWALKDKSGIPALTFSQMAPTPNVGWLPKLQDAGLLDIPLPPSLQITRHYEPELNLLGAARPLSHWILHHLNNPRLLSWFVENGFSLLAHFRFLLSERLHTIENMSADSLAAEKKNFPDCIPQKEYLWAWRLVANGCVSSHQQGSPLRDLAAIHDLTDQHDLTASDHVSLREKLTPRIEISKNFSFEKILAQERHPPFFKLFSVDLVLRDNCIHSILHTYSNKLPPKRRIEILPDLEYALKTGLDLATEANGGKPSFIEAGFSLPSIEDSDQNLAVKEWSELVHAIAKGWVDLDRSKPAEAALMATR